MNKENFIKELLKININIDNDTLTKLDKYLEFLLEYNTHTNLTSIKNKEDVYLKHFYDCLTLTKLVNFKNEKVLDIGSGAGFPGLVLAIVYPNLKITLLDSNNKKIEFLNKCIELLKLKNVNTIYDRSENYTKKVCEEYDYITFRAVAEVRILTEIAINALKVNGSLLFMKANINNELENSQNTFKVLNCKIKKLIEFELPYEAGHRTLIEVTKISHTDKKYPREYDKIKKKPL